MIFGYIKLTSFHLVHYSAPRSAFERRNQERARDSKHPETERMPPWERERKKDERPVNVINLAVNTISHKKTNTRFTRCILARASLYLPLEYAIRLSPMLLHRHGLSTELGPLTGPSAAQFYTLSARLMKNIANRRPDGLKIKIQTNLIFRLCGRQIICCV